MCWLYCLVIFFFKQKTAYEMRISDWSSDVCSSDLGNEYDSVFGIAPVGLGALYRYRGDIELATAARIRNVPYVLSGASLTPLEEVIKAAPNAWFQAYLPGERIEIRRLLERVSNAGFKTLVITVDVPVSVHIGRAHV